MNKSRPDPGSTIPVDELHAADLNRCIRKFRAFLGQKEILAASERIKALTRTVNPFRELVLAEKQPWPQTFEEFDRLTLNGGRNLPIEYLTVDLLEAARAGRILDNILPTIPGDVQDQMRARLLDLHGKAFPVLMEWSVANFFARREYRPAWTPVGQAGPEFVCDGHGIRFEIECKRSTRQAKELLGDRDALTLGHAVLQAVTEIGFDGDLSLDTTLTSLDGNEQAVVHRLRQLLPQVIDQPAQIAMAEFGNLAALPRQAPLRATQARAHIDARRVNKANFARFFSLSEATTPEGLVRGLKTLDLISPRRSNEEWLGHIEAEMTGGVQQLSGTCAGLIFVQIESVEDARLFRDKQPFRDINARLLGAHPYLEAIVWQAVPPVPELRGNFVVGYEIFAERQANRVFAEGRAIPLSDDEATVRRDGRN